MVFRLNGRESQKLDMPPMSGQLSPIETLDTGYATASVVRVTEPPTSPAIYCLSAPLKHPVAGGPELLNPAQGHSSAPHRPTCPPPFQSI